MTTRFCALLPVLMSFFVPEARAEPITLGEVFASVDAHHPRLVRERSRVTASEGELTAALGAFDPRLRLRSGWVATGAYESRRLEAAVETQTPLYGLSLSGEYRLTRGGVPVYDGRLETLDAGELRLVARMPLLQDLRIDAARAGRDRAAIDVTIAEAQRDAARLELARGAAVAFFRWVYSVRSRDVADQQLELAERRDGQLRRLAEVGSIPPIEARENERVVLSRRARRVAAEQRLRQAAIGLSLFLRDSEGAPRVPTDDEAPAVFVDVGDPPTVEELVAEAMERRPDLLAARAQIERADVAVELARTGRLPRLDATLSMSSDVGGGTSDQRSRLGAAVVEASLSVSSPIPNRTGTGRFDARSADVEALDADYSFVLEQLRAQITEARIGVLAAQEALSLEQQALVVANELAAAEYRRFEEGATTLLMVNLREQIAADTELSVAERTTDLGLAAALLSLGIGRFEP